MATTMSADAMLDRFFLDMRARVLDLAASLDRIGRAPGGEKVARDERMRGLAEALRVLTESQNDRAARVQMIFSDPYDPSWPRPTR